MQKTLKDAYDKCEKLAFGHYENFPVARLVPKAVRPHISAVYAFARTADDIADEQHDSIPADSPERVERLDAYENLLDETLKTGLCPDPNYAWIFEPCADTISKFSVPVGLFKDLLSAFKQDVVKKRYETFDELKDYCRRSANPVGRLVLILHGLGSEERFKMSDAICTALQLANFWQDMSVDKDKGRIYVPQCDWNGLSEDDFLKSESASDKMRQVVKFQVERTRSLFDQGDGLPKTLPFPLSLEIRLTLAGGRTICDMVEKRGFDTISGRPHIGSLDKLKILLKSIF